MQQAFWKFPDSTKYGRKIPKEQIYQRTKISSDLKSLFIKQVETIIWEYKLAPNTLNIQATKDVEEIEVFTLKLKGDELDKRILQIIDTVIPYPIIYQIAFKKSEYHQIFHYVACYKTLLEKNIRCSNYLFGQYLLVTGGKIREDITNILMARQKEIITEIDLPISINMKELYQNLLLNLLPIQKKEDETIEEAISRFSTIQILEKQIAQKTKKLNLEKQFNRKVALNSEIKRLKKQCEELIK